MMITTKNVDRVDWAFQFVKRLRREESGFGLLFLSFRTGLVSDPPPVPPKMSFDTARKIREHIDRLLEEDV